jgi:GrpB-like predicted nucleotidyltransferase (UPF0157 family)
MLGLQYGCVQLVPSHPEWVDAFREESRLLAGTLAGISCEVEHIGSSSVPGLLAKPIIDIAVGVSDEASAEAAITAIVTAGYEYRGDAGTEGGHVLVRESEPLVRTHHVHVVRLGGTQWEAYLLFREHLKQSEASRRAYSAEKQELAIRHSEDHTAYTKAKDGIVQRLLAEARGDL